MTELALTTRVAAEPQRCFDLACSMEFHSHSFRATEERIVGGRAAGLICLGELVEFEGRHLGMTHRLKARTTECDPPKRFVDEQVAGPFRSLRHEHLFDAVPGGTRVTDRVVFAVGRGPLGWLAERLIVRPHL